MGEAKFWHQLEDNERYVKGWYWHDDQCEEAMGPFDTEGEARADHWDLRVKNTEKDEKARQKHLDEGID